MNFPYLGSKEPKTQLGYPGTFLKPLWPTKKALVRALNRMDINSKTVRQPGKLGLSLLLAGHFWLESWLVRSLRDFEKIKKEADERLKGGEFDG